MNKKELSPKQREELLGVLKARFEKNMTRQSWKAVLKNCGRSTKWKTLAVNRMLLVMIRRPANTFFSIARRKVLKDAEVSATTVKRWSRGKKINQQITLWI